MTASITIKFSVPIGYIPGDYAMLFSNGGAGDIDWNSPVNAAVYPLFPNGAGLLGFGHAPFGHHRFGHGHDQLTAGFGHAPFGHTPFGHGTAIIEASVRVTECGSYTYAFGCYDAAGNLHQGSPEEATANVHIASPPPTRLTKDSYNKTTDVLTLDAA